MIRKASNYIRFLDQLTDTDGELVGREAVFFSNIYRTNLKVPASFVVTTLCFDDFLTANNLVGPLVSILKQVKPFVRESAENASQQIANIIFTARIPDLVVEEIVNAYNIIDHGKNNTFVSLELSHILEGRYIPLSLRDKDPAEICGAEALVNKIKFLWFELFTPEAIELRTNGYYKGALSTAIVVKQDVRQEISGKAYSIPPITKENDSVELHAVYGTWSREVENNADIYKIDIKEGTIYEKNIISQDYMLIKKGKIENQENPLLQVPISREWRRSQKLDDERIFTIAKTLLIAEKALGKPIELKWGVQGGDIFITDIDEIFIKPDLEEIPFENNIEKTEEYIAKEIDDEVKKLTIMDQEYNKNGPDFDALQKEINQIVQNNKKALTEDINKAKKKDLKLISTKSGTKLITKLPTKSISERINIQTKLFIDVTGTNIATFNLLDFFDGAFIDGTSIILEHDTLPEAIAEDRQEVNALIDSYTIDLSILARNCEPKEMIYQFSNIGEDEHKLLNINSTQYNFFGDERFIEYPESLIIESLAVKKSKIINGCNNISISFPAIRSTQNLEDLKTIISKNGLKRSANLKFYVELSIPSFVHDLENIEPNFIDGIILDYSTLLRLSVYRKETREVDHQILIDIVKKVTQICSAKNIELLIKTENLEPNILDKLMHLKPDGIIFTQIPTQETLSSLKKIEAK